MRNFATMKETLPLKIFNDDEFGPIKVFLSRCHNVAYGVTIDGEVFVKVPFVGRRSFLPDIANINEDMRLKLRKIINRQALKKKEQEAVAAPAVYDENTVIGIWGLQLKIIRSNKQLAQLVGNEIRIQLLPDDNILAPDIQSRIKNVIVASMKIKSRKELPVWLDRLARQHGFTYTGVSINSAQSRWGSCSYLKHINLSFYLLLLPQHLIEYVLLHELCHTVEMNHGPRFYALLNRVCGGHAEDYRQEMKKYRTNL